MKVERFGRHPLCTCPPDTFVSSPDRQPCRDRAAPVNPHPVLTAEDMRALALALRSPR